LDPDLFSVDGDCNGPYVSVAEFDSYDEAMKQSNDPAATESANKWDALLDEPPRSYNLNIVRDLERQRELRSAALIAEWAWAEHPLGPDGELNKLGFQKYSPRTKAATSNCHAEALVARVVQTPAELQRHLDQMLKIAQSMRAHGVPGFPDSNS